jgi:hypothetical protein
VIPADIHQLDEAALPSARNRKRASRWAVHCFPRRRPPASSARRPTSQRATISDELRPENPHMCGLCSELAQSSSPWNGTAETGNLLNRSTSTQRFELWAAAKSVNCLQAPCNWKCNLSQFAIAHQPLIPRFEVIHQGQHRIEASVL